VNDAIIRAMACKACVFPQRDRVDQELFASVPFRTIHQWSGLSLGCLSRHFAHLRRDVGLALKVRSPDESTEHGADLLNRGEALFTQATELLETCRREKNFRGAAGFLTAAGRLLELLARLRGELSPSGGVHLNFTSHKVTINQNAGGDEELALLIQEATDRFNPDTIARLRALAESAENSHEPAQKPALPTDHTNTH
jgi:hypothetical protein